MPRLLLVILLFAVPSIASRAGEVEPIAWGEVQGNLRARLIPVSATMREDAIDPTKRKDVFESADTIAFVVELQNVGREPILLVDTKNRGKKGAPDTPHSDWLSQFLVSLHSLDDHGRPDYLLFDAGEALMDAVVTTLPPGETHRTLIRPARWLSPTKYRPRPGTHRVSITYHGAPAHALDKIRKYRKDHPLLKTAPVTVTTPPVAFRLNGPVGERERIWGEPQDGLRAAAVFVPNRGSHTLGTRPTLELHVQNVSKRPIAISSTLTLPKLKAMITDAGGRVVKVVDANYLGEHYRGRLTLQPKQIAIFQAGNLAVAEMRADSFPGKTHRKLVAPPGRYLLRLSGPVGDKLPVRDATGNSLSPLPGDWQGALASGPTPFVIAK